MKIAFDKIKSFGFKARQKSPEILLGVGIVGTLNRVHYASLAELKEFVEKQRWSKGNDDYIDFGLSPLDPENNSEIIIDFNI